MLPARSHIAYLFVTKFRGFQRVILDRMHLNQTMRCPRVVLHALL